MGTVRADRLVAILLLLQQRGQVTAAEVADELEVSERTARRDLDALGMAGLPVYAVQGRGGGWRLAGGGRTDLSGLTAAEARALFLVAGPQAGATKEVRAALRKLVRALPEPLRERAEVASNAMVVDPSDWDRPVGSRPPPPFLDEVQRAVVESEQVRLGYVARDGAVTTRVVHPLGVGAKGSTWYLFAATEAGQRAFRVDRITAVEPTGERAVRPPGFDLAEAWRQFVAEVDLLRTPLVARGAAAPANLGLLRMILGTRVGIGAAGEDGRVHVELRGHSVPALAAEIAGLATLVEVLDPPELRAELGRLGARLVDTYGAPA
jgi:predicted DNA-binding transcriptional regulator YafY